MKVIGQKPILLTGLGMSVGLWAWTNLHIHLGQLGEWGILSAIALSAGAWLLQPQASPKRETPLIPLHKEEVLAWLKTLEENLAQLAKTDSSLDLTPHYQTLATLSEELNRSELKVALVGKRKVGKTSCQNLLTLDNTEFQESLPLLRENSSNPRPLAAEVILFLVDGDLTDSEWQILQEYQRAHYRLLLVFNKQDQYSPEEKTLILQQLRERVKSCLPESDVLAIAAAPVPIKVRQYQPEGEVKEWLETNPPDLGTLKERLQTILSQEKEQLLLGSLWRKAQGLASQIQAQEQEIRRDRALPLIEKYQWLSAATALANPIASIDLVATTAINAQMIVDIGAVYQQKLSLAQAQTIAATLGKSMLQLGLVELSSQAIAAFLKSHALTYLAGGTVQGISAAYLTRLAGLSLIEYYQSQASDPTEEQPWHLELLTQKLQQVFAQNQRLDVIQNFVKQALSKNPIPLNS